jgi:hypothetical protein
MLSQVRQSSPVETFTNKGQRGLPWPKPEQQMKDPLMTREGDLVIEIYSRNLPGLAGA